MHSTTDVGELARFADAVAVAVAIVSVDGRILFTNPAFGQLLGTLGDPLNDEPIGRIVPDLDPAAWCTQGEADDEAGDVTFASGPGTAAENSGVYRVLRVDGSSFPAAIARRPVSVGGLRLFCLSFTDLSERTMAATGVRVLLDATPCGMLVIDDQGKIVMTNPLLCRTFGYDASELMGRPVEMLMPERLREAHAQHRRAYCDAPTARAMGGGRELLGRRKDGVAFPIEVALSPMDTPEGKRFVAAVVDISQRRRTESQLREANAQLDAFSDVCTHELRAPLRAVDNLIEFLREELGEAVDAPIGRGLDQIQTRVERMSCLIDDLHAFAEAMRPSVVVEPIELSSLVDDILDRRTAEGIREVAARVEVPTFRGARLPLETVIGTLVNQAVDRAEASPLRRLTLVARIDGDYCVVDLFEDARPQEAGPDHDGAAVEPMTADSLFPPPRAVRQAHGGVGLAVARRLAEGHGGRLRLVAGPEARGCHYQLWWPRFAGDERRH